jgi:hypothetical protein
MHEAGPLQGRLAAIPSARRCTAAPGRAAAAWIRSNVGLSGSRPCQPVTPCQSGVTDIT